MTRALAVRIYVVATLLVGAYLGLNQWMNLRAAGSTLEAWKPFVWEFTSVTIIFALVPLVVRLEQRFPVDAKPRWRVVLAHLAGGVAFSAVHVAFIVTTRKLAYWLAGGVYDFGDFWIASFYELQKDLIVYGVILVVLFAVREYRVRRAGEMRAAELAAELGEARLRQLTAQIEPHFLFNSLNAISNRMHEDVNAADCMMSQLGDLLRAAYDADDSVLVPLARELEWLRGYTAMMAERFRGRLVCEIDVEADLDSVLVPRLLLQPIVENALRHGLADGNGSLRLTVRRSGNRLECVVADDGAGLPDDTLSPGTGLGNVARRLELLFPRDHTFVITPTEPRGVAVHLSFPVET